MNTTRQYSTFYVDRFHFGIEVEDVQEALHPMPTTPVPLTTDIVDGLVNLRGQIIMALDLRARLQLPRRADCQPSVSLILRTTSGLISIRVDRLGEVIDSDTRKPAASDFQVTESTPARAENAEPGNGPLEPLPDTVDDPLRQLARGVLQLDDSLLLVLDPQRLADPAACLREE